MADKRHHSTNESPAFRDVEEALDYLDGRGSDGEWKAIKFLRGELGEELPSFLLKKYRASTRYGARASCVFHAIRHARDVPAAVNLGILALSDRASVVRYRACMLLAYAQDKSALGSLKDALRAAKGKFREDIEASIDAIESENHHYFVDREHSGKVTLNIG